MKKALIAGTVSLAVAAMPVVGVFAAGTSQTDTIKVNIAQTCTIVSATHNDGDGETANGTWNADVLSGDMVAGTVDNDYGSTEFTIKCNAEKGWKVTMNAGDLNIGTEGGTDKIPFSTTAVTKDASGYNVTTSGAGAKGLANSANMVVATEENPTLNAGSKFTAKYAVAVEDGQAAGTYEGTVQYTLAAL